jgi:hypothetical protein
MGRIDGESESGPGGASSGFDHRAFRGMNGTKRAEPTWANLENPMPVQFLADFSNASKSRRASKVYTSLSLDHPSRGADKG